METRGRLLWLILLAVQCCVLTTAATFFVSNQADIYDVDATNDTTIRITLITGGATTEELLYPLQDGDIVEILDHGADSTIEIREMPSAGSLIIHATMGSDVINVYRPAIFTTFANLIVVNGSSFTTITYDLSTSSLATVNYNLVVGNQNISGNVPRNITWIGPLEALNVACGAGSDTIEIRQTSSNIDILDISGGQGSDTITVSSVHSLLFVDGGEGNDEFIIGQAGEVASVINNDVGLICGEGNDLVVADGRAQPGGAITMDFELILGLSASGFGIFGLYYDCEYGNLTLPTSGTTTLEITDTIFTIRADIITTMDNASTTTIDIYYLTGSELAVNGTGSGTTVIRLTPTTVDKHVRAMQLPGGRTDILVDDSLRYGYDVDALGGVLINAAGLHGLGYGDVLLSGSCTLSILFAVSESFEVYIIDTPSPLSITMGTHADLISVSATSHVLTVDTGGGDDTFEFLNVSAVNAPVSYTAGSGEDSLLLTYGGTVAMNITGGGSLISGVFGADAMHYSLALVDATSDGLEYAEFNLGDGDDSLLLELALYNIYVDARKGHDRIQITNCTQAVELFGGDGNDVLFVGTLLGSFGWLQGDAGADQLGIGGTAATTAFVDGYGGPGNDSFISGAITNATDTLRGRVSFFGGPDVDTMIVRDSSSTAAREGSVRGGMFVGFGVGCNISYSAIPTGSNVVDTAEYVQVELSNVQSASFIVEGPLSPTTVIGGNGPPHTVQLKHTAQSITVQFNADGDILTTSTALNITQMITVYGASNSKVVIDNRARIPTAGDSVPNPVIVNATTAMGVAGAPLRYIPGNVGKRLTLDLKMPTTAAFAQAVVIDGSLANVEITGSDGNDTVTVHASSGKTLFIGNGGDDVLTLTDVLAITGSVSYDGGPGNDTMSATNPNDTLGVQAVFASANITGLLGAGNVSFLGAVEYATIALSAAQDVFGLINNNASIALTILLGGGNDMFEAVNGRGTVTVHGQDGQDKFNLTSVVSATWTLHGGGDDDMVTIYAADSSALTIHGDEGNDTVVLGNQSTDLIVNSVITIFGDEGTDDAVAFYDAESPIARSTVRLDDNVVSGLSPSSTVQYDDTTERVLIELSAGSNMTVNVTTTEAPLNTTICKANEDDVVTLVSTTQPVTVLVCRPIPPTTAAVSTSTTSMSTTASTTGGIIPCYNGGTFNYTTQQCDCTDGWGGIDCRVCVLTCSNNGTLNATTCMCECPAYWAGRKCDQCNLTCAHGSLSPGQCEQCTCPLFEYWVGSACDTCNLTCRNNGSVPTDGTCYACQCPGFWIGAECTTCNISCKNEGLLDADNCTCKCPKKWKGDQCEKCALVCRNFGILVETDENGQPHCECKCVGPFVGPVCEIDSRTVNVNYATGGAISGASTAQSGADVQSLELSELLNNEPLLSRAVRAVRSALRGSEKKKDIIWSSDEDIDKARFEKLTTPPRFYFQELIMNMSMIVYSSEPLSIRVAGLSELDPAKLGIFALHYSAWFYAWQQVAVTLPNGTATTELQLRPLVVEQPETQLKLSSLLDSKSNRR